MFMTKNPGSQMLLSLAVTALLTLLSDDARAQRDHRPTRGNAPSNAGLKPPTPKGQQTVWIPVNDTDGAFPLLKRGDREFDGNGPDITVSANILKLGNQLVFQLKIKDVEGLHGKSFSKFTEKDFSTAEGTRNTVFYEAPPGYRIRSVSGKKKSTRS